MELESALIYDELTNPQLEEFITTINMNHTAKSAAMSINGRQEGNRLYIQKDHSANDHEEILNHYSKSIAYAPYGSEELALAYGNRSALLLHLKKYHESIRDVDRAIGITASNSLKVKLFCRKVECLTALGLPENCKAFEEAKECFEKVYDNEKDKVSLANTMNKAKIILDLNKAKLAPMKDDESEAFKILLEKAKANPFDSVNIKYSKKYGRYLAANRNFKPGEIIYVEKPYALCSSIQNPYIYCTNCLAVAWSGVPCKSCSLSIFCSEKCREEAWKKYHDVECSIIPYLKELNKNLAYNFQLSIRIMIMGIKEYGGIDKLKVNLTEIDNCKDKRKKGFTKDGKFRNDQFKSVYSLSHYVSDDDYATNVQTTAIIIACIAKYTLFFGTDVLKNQSLSSLSQNKDVLFIGSLLLRLIQISCVNRFSVFNATHFCKHSNDPMVNLMNKCCSKGVCFASISSLLNNSCVPNAARLFTENQNIVIYCLEPIDKNDQLFLSYLSSFYDTPELIVHRRAMLKQHFYFTCNCVACERNWPSLLNPRKEDEKAFLNAPRSFLEEKFIEEFREIIQSANNETYEYKTIPNLAKGIEKATKLLPQPCTIRCIFTFTLQRIFEKVYGYNIHNFEKD